MRKILLLSDTHGYLDERIIERASQADEVWHAGDIGTPEILDKLRKVKLTRAVYGNIDGHELRLMCPEHLAFDCEGMKVMMIHIAGAFGKYTPQTKALLEEHKPKLLICGHSHILVVKKDNRTGHFHINPGAAGKSGFHTVRTVVQFSIDRGSLRDMEVVELGPRSGSTKPVG